ncbi:MAG: SHOCT domain-containing protein [Ferrovibrio sp.]
MSSDEIARLHKLFKDGALTEAEFNEQKKLVLGQKPASEGSPGVTEWSKLSFWQKQWFVGLLLLLFIPAALLLMWTTTIYRKKRGAVVPMTRGEKVAFSGVGLLLLGLVIPKLIADLQMAPTCASEEAQQTLLSAFSESQFARQQSLSIVEIISPSETSYDGRLRTCQAQADLNNGTSLKLQFTMEPRGGGDFMLHYKVAGQTERRIEDTASRVGPNTPHTRPKLQEPVAQQSQEIQPTRLNKDDLFEGSWDRQRNVLAAVAAFRRKQQADGVVGVIDATSDCHADAQASQDAQKVEYCIAFDLMAFNYYQFTATQNGWPLPDQWERDAFFERQGESLDSIGIPPKDNIALITSLEKLVIKAFTIATQQNN